MIVDADDKDNTIMMVDRPKTETGGIPGPVISEDKPLLGINDGTALEEGDMAKSPNDRSAVGSVDENDPIGPNYLLSRSSSSPCTVNIIGFALAVVATSVTMKLFLT